MQKYNRLVLGRLLIAEGRNREALEVLQGLLPAFKERERLRAMVEVYILMALANQAEGDSERALDSLSSAVELAQPGGLVRVFVDEGRPMAQLIYCLAQRGMASRYLEKLLGAFSLEDRAQIYSKASGFGLVQPLSQRELEVLELIAEGNTNQEIARILVLAESTIKVHTRNIYRKLDVSKRTQALKRARNLGIL
jgi:LuxR family maltose regulon positive regulatory protein